MGEHATAAQIRYGPLGWRLRFRHPFRGTEAGHPHIVRLRLQTHDKSIAQKLADEANELLADDAWWSEKRHDAAAKRFHRLVVRAFYGDPSATARDSWSERDSVVALPGGKGSNDGFVRILMIGTTGAGKTTLVRQLIGTDPTAERFPSTSAAKTTVSDLEVILDGGPFRGVVTFFERSVVRQNIAECLSSAVRSAANGGSDREVRRRFLEHHEQRFRLSYVLGKFAEPSSDESLDEHRDGANRADDGMIGIDERRQLGDRLERYFDRVKLLAKAWRTRLESEAAQQGIELANATEDARDRLEEAVDDAMPSDEAFDALVDDILDDCEGRFAQLAVGEFARDGDGWPTSWRYESQDRAAFLSTINRFSSNYEPQFGRLLTPFVEGIRIAGPFRPGWHEGQQPRLVIMDGQGLGHTPQSVSSVSTSITRRYDLCDAILLVDNASQPMQAATHAVVESLVASGHDSKLMVCFTHFDAVKADNLSNDRDREDHVLASFDNTIAKLRETHGRVAAKPLEAAASARTFFLADIQKPLATNDKYTRRQLVRLLNAIAGTIAPPRPTAFKPQYDAANFVLAIQSAIQEFHELWGRRLFEQRGFQRECEHWTRVKALTRRLGIFRADEYDTLKPVADLIRLLQTHLSRSLEQPLAWDPYPPAEADEARAAAIAPIRNEMHRRLHDFARRRILDSRIRKWLEAYEYRGAGSAQQRARSIVDLYARAAPIPNEVPGPDANEFLNEMRELASESIKAGGGRLKDWTPTERPPTK